MSDTTSNPNNPASAHKQVSTSGTSSRGSLLHTFEMATSPLVGVLVLWAVCGWVEGGVYPEHLLLSVICFALTFPGSPRLGMGPRELVADVVLSWAAVFGLLFATAWATSYLPMFSHQLLYTWVAFVPVVDVVAWWALRRGAPVLVRLQGPPRRALVLGMNPQGLHLADTLKASPFLSKEVVGFIDDRSPERIPQTGAFPLLGRMSALAEVVRTQHISDIYISLPMASQPRILKLLDDLKDTTASIYFVPDLFVTDLIQSKPTLLRDVPVIAVCDTPFQGLNGALKRGSDVVLASLILLALAPVLLGVAVAVKRSSPGPVIFKQRRYGQDGHEILVYKFRSMRVAEDGDQIKQAQRNDSRITPVGAFLRKTSLDELPQFINVLQGRMSIVGPRPHAVAHNEQYRKLIKGYMVRHKVKPGITGWAQVNGYRGETDTLDKMEARIEYDLDYLRHWSLKLDMLIILKTVRLVFKDQQAY